MLLAILHLALQLTVIAPRALTTTGHNWDAVVYYVAARNVYTHRDLYKDYPDYGPDSPPQDYDYAPPFAAIIALLGSFSFEVFSKIWFCLLLFSFWVFAYCLARLYNGKSQTGVTDVLIGGLVIALLPGGYSGVLEGNINPFLWALIAVGLVGSARSTLWAVAALIKPFCIWPLMADAVKRRKEGGVKVLIRSLAPAVLIIFILIVYGGIVCGWQSYLFWIRDVLPTLSQGSFNSQNVSFSFAVIRLASLLGWNYMGGPLPLPAHLWLTAASIGAPLLAWWLSRNYSIQLTCACMIAASALFAPVCWLHYLPFLLPLFALLLKEMAARPAPSLTELRVDAVKS